MYLVKTPKFIQGLFPNFTWRIPSQEKTLYLTFDDGPIPEVTPWVLDQLAKFDAHATFFCVGENVDKHPNLLQQVIDAGHAVGNHTYHHYNGWAADNIPYYHDVRHCARLVNSVLFRPPYGRLKPKQMQFLQRHYRIVMWDVLSGDFDASISAAQCLANVVDHAVSGSIVVFHDSLKASEKLFEVLPQVLRHFSDEGYNFRRLRETEMVQETPIRQTA